MSLSKTKAVFDIETNGFLPDVDKIWMIVIEDLQTEEVFSYVSKDGTLNAAIKAGLRKLDSYDVIIGHNIIGYDILVLNHLCSWIPAGHVKQVDTWILSQTNQYKRSHKHSIEGWGEKLGKQKEGLGIDFSVYSEEMLNRCVSDVKINTLVYKELMGEIRSLTSKNPLYIKGLEVEMEFAKLESEIRTTGWLFDMEAAERLLAEINSKLTHIEETIEPKIGMRCIKKDGTDYKTPAWRKDGCYTVSTAKWFDIPIEAGKPGRNGRPIEGPYCRIYYEQGKLSSIEVVKDYLYSIGWVIVTGKQIGRAHV